MPSEVTLRRAKTALSEPGRRQVSATANRLTWVPQDKATLIRFALPRPALMNLVLPSLALSTCWRSLSKQRSPRKRRDKASDTPGNGEMP
jgi:hypothetical protein